ncbi:MAG: GGDEF domain-containing protein [bacterium]|nr:GGDEF domain-containing protein [bacterium]
MTSSDDRERIGISGVTLEFLEVFLPFEIQLAQRRALTWAQHRPNEAAQTPSIGLYLLKLFAQASTFPSSEYGGDEIGDVVHETVQSTIRDSDVPSRLANDEHMVIARDVDPQLGHIVAQRVLTTVSRLPQIQRTGITARIGYLVYPLSPQPNFSPSRWPELVSLARQIGEVAEIGPAASGYGILRGPKAGETALPESDLIPLAFEDLDTLVSAGVLRTQRVHLLPTN